MPAMDLKGDEWNWARVLTYMEYPHDEHLRNLSFDRYLREEILNLEGSHIPLSELPEGFREGIPDHVDSILNLEYGFRVRANNHGGTYEASHELYNRVLRSACHEHLLRGQESNRKYASTAGKVLAYLWVMKQDGRHQPSLGKAMALVEYDPSRNQGWDPESAKRIRVKLFRYWKTYKGVAHLWAAVTLANLCPPLKEGDIFRNPELFKSFLAIAEDLRKFGEAYLPPNTKNPCPVLSPDETWRIPDSFVLPEVAELSLSFGLWAYADDFLVNDYCHER